MEMNKEIRDMELRNENISLPKDMTKRRATRKIEPVAHASDSKESAEKVAYISPAEALHRKVNHLRDKGREMVKGIFYDNEVKGGSSSMMVRLHKGDKLKKYDFTDRGVYTIPRSVYKHLRDNCAYAVHAYLMDENGKNNVVEGMRIRR